jgi:hypothetical protein
MRLYPQLPVRRANTVVLDAATLIAVVVFALLGLWVHDSVAKLDVLGRGVHDAGAAVQNGFDSAADAVRGTPLVGGAIAGGLRGAGRHTGAPVAEAGTRGVRRVHRLADLLGALVFGLPTAMLLSRFLPRRVEQVRKLTAASRVLRDGDETRRRLVAERAAFGLPYGLLLRYTRDPIGDLAVGRHDALIAAALEDAGLLPSSS